MGENHDQLYGILLNLQRQVGDMDTRVSTELGKQTSTLDGIDKKATYTNGKIADAILRVSKIEVQLADYPEVRKGARDVMTWKHGLIMMFSLFVLIGGAIWGIIKFGLDAYLRDKYTTFKAEDNLIINDSGWKNQ